MRSSADRVLRKASERGFVLVVALLLPWRPALATTAPQAGPELRDSLRRVERGLGRGFESSDGSPLEELPPAIDERELRRRLARAQRAMASAGGSEHWVDPFFERQSEASDDGRRAELARQAGEAVGTIAEETERALAAKTGTSDRIARATEAREILDEVLADPVFRRFPLESAPPSGFTRWVAALFDWWHKLALPPIPGAFGSAGRWFVGALIIVATGVVAWRVLRAQLSKSSGSPRFRRPEASRQLDDDTLPFGDLDRALARALIDGAFRDALRLLHLATLGRLQSDARIAASPGLTHWEHLRALDQQGVSARALERFGELNSAFDAAWYGGADVGAEEFRRFQGSTQRFQEEMLSSAPAPAPAHPLWRS